MKKKIIDNLNRFLLILLAFLPAFVLIRLAESLSLIFQHSLMGNVWIMELHGLFLDCLVFFSFAIFVFIVFLLISLLHRKTGIIVAVILFLIYVMTSLALTTYFTKTLVPLDQVIFFFTPYESFRIVVSSTRVDLPGLVTFLLVFAIPLVLYFFIRKFRIRRLFQIILVAVIILSPISLKFLVPNQSKFKNDFEYFARCSKMEYLVQKIYLFKTLKTNIDWNDKSLGAAVKRYHAINPEFSYVSQKYPLLRLDHTPDVLGEYFSFGPEKPNIVFVIVESLSSSFCGEKPYYGSFMPFLDSLIGHSLYWKNCLSTSERTFNVLPAVFGSLPYSDERFRVPLAPLHFSLIRYLNENGYSSQFFYGGDPYMGGTQNFLEHEQIDYILPYFGKDEKEKEKAKLFEWGDYDGVLFRRAFRALDSLHPAAPRLDIYQTLTTHAPFTIPDEKYYSRLCEDRIRKMDLNPEVKRMVSLQKNIFSTILYTDESLREFFNYYRKRKDFNNTIFIITGDHAMPELNYSYLNLLEKYHVPLVIYSPMLKKSQKFESVSSHLDIAPSILAMLRNQGFIKVRPLCHWLGKGLDVTRGFQNKHAISFILNNRSMEEYISGNYFLSKGRLFRLLPDLKLYIENNAVIMNKLQNELADYLNITERIKERESLIPDDLLFYENYTEESYESAKPEKVGQTSTEEEYFSLVKSHKIRQDYKMIRIELSAIMKKKPGDTAALPKVVVQITDDKNQNCAWFQFPVEKDSLSVSGDKVILRKWIDLGNVKDIASKSLNIYFYNPDKREFSIDSMKISLKGYKYR